MTERAKTIAEELNAGLPGNIAGKPVVEGTEITGDDDDSSREQLDPSEHDDVWANATVTEHDPGEHRA